MNIEEYLEGKTYIDSWFPTGSNYICNPPVIDTDIDFVCFCEDSQYMGSLSNDNWILTNPDEEGKYQGCERYFDTYRKDKYNLIITQDFNFYCRFVNATVLAKSRNLINKQDRIDLFQEILYGKG